MALITRRSPATAFVASGLVLAGFVLLASPYVLFLHSHTGNWRLEGKWNINYTSGSRLHSGLNDSEALYGIDENQQEAGPLLDPARFANYTPYSHSWRDKLHYMLLAVRQNREAAYGTILSPQLGEPFVLILIAVGLFRHVWSPQRLVHETVLGVMVLSILILLLTGAHLEFRYADATVPFLESVPRVYDHLDDRQTWVASTIQSELGLPKDRVIFCEHHLSHAASAFLCSPFDEAAILTVDGVGEWTTGTWGTGRGNEIKLTGQTEFPHSIGLLYSAFTAFLGFEVNEGEYKVMGMAPYGQPRYVDKVWKVVKQHEDGSFSLDMSYFSFHHSTDKTFNRRFVELFGEPRPPQMYFFTRASGYPYYFGEKPANYDELCEGNQYYADIAASIQRVTEELLLGMARHVYRQTGMKKLCIAGGVGLNSVASGRILRETPFEELFIQPAAGDGGGALGAALWAYNSLLGKPRTFCMNHAYWGQSYDSGEIRHFLAENSIPHKFIENY